MHTKTFHRKKIFIVFGLSLVMLIGLAGRLVWLMVFEADYYQQLATDLHERERSIKAARGRILDRNGEVLADNRTVCTISVIHSQIEDPEAVIRMLVKELELPEELTGSYAAYNELQLAQGFDLRDYLGQGVSRWTYQVQNYPDRPEDVQLNLYLCEDRPIAGDIIAGGEGGFQGTLRYPGE